jgi:transposase-like protein
MEGRQRRSFTDDYKRQAVDLVASSGRSIGSVAKELGLRESVLRRWVELRGAHVPALAKVVAQMCAKASVLTDRKTHNTTPSDACAKHTGWRARPPAQFAGREASQR